MFFIRVLINVLLCRWGPFTKEEANVNYLNREGMYEILKIVFDVTPCDETT
jgi:hypothetical protein